MKRIVGLFVLTLLASAVIGLFAQSEGKEYVIGETWTVDGQWSVTITHVEATIAIIKNNHSQKQDANQ